MPPERDPPDSGQSLGRGELRSGLTSSTWSILSRGDLACPHRPHDVDPQFVFLPLFPLDRRRGQNPYYVLGTVFVTWREKTRELPRWETRMKQANKRVI